MKKLVNILMTLALCCTIFLNGSMWVSAAGASAEVDVEDLMNRGQEAYDNFLEVSSFIKDDASWEKCLNYYDKITRVSAINREAYLDSVADATEEQFDAMTAYEIMVYMETYLMFALMVENGSSDDYIYNDERGIALILDLTTSMWKGNDSEKVIAAYEEFVNWQIEYYRIYNFPYNFITGKSYAEETHQDFGIENAESVEQGADSEAEDVIEDFDDDEVKEILNELTDDEKSEIAKEVDAYEVSSLEEEEEPKSFVLPIVLVAVIVVVGIVVVVMQKKRK